MPAATMKISLAIRAKLILSFLSVLLVSCAPLTPQSESPETSVCGSIQEPLIFWLWRRSAGEVNPALARQIENAQAITYTTSDGRVLQGYRLKHTAKDGVVRGHLLLAQGNAMLADQLLWHISDFSAAGIEVYLFDYRGYGRSEGKRRLNAIISDYKAIFEHLVPKNSGRRFLYGISFGGIVMSNLIGSGVEFDRAVIDSSPSRLSNHGCQKQYDPVLNVPQDASRIMLITGEKDRVVKPADSQELRATIEQHGGLSVFHPDFAHPFMDASMEIHRARMALIKRFLLDEAAE